MAQWGGEARPKKFSPPLEKCVGHSLKILGIVQKILAPLGKLFAPPGVPSWLLARMEPQPSRIDWLKATAHEREDYYHESKNLLDQLQLPTEIRHSQNFNCTDQKHLEEIENLYADQWPVL